MNLIQRIFNGAKCPIVGFSFLFSGPKLWKWAAIPVLLTAALVTAGTVWGTSLFGSYFSSVAIGWTAFLTGLPGIGPWFSTGSMGYHFVNGLMTATVALISVLIWAYGCYVGARLVLVPFSSIMAEKTLQHLNVLNVQVQSPSERASRIVRSLLTGILQVIFLSVVGVLLFGLAFIPGLQLFVGLAGMLLISFDCADYAFEFADLNLRNKLKVFSSRFPEFLGFSIVAGLTFLIPVLNLLLLPALIIGAARLVSSFSEIWKTN